MGGYPALAIRPPESPIQQLGQVEQVVGARQQQQLRGQEIQAGGINLQMQQLALKNMQTVQSALSEPTLEQQFNDYQKSKGAAPTGIANESEGIGGELHPMAQFLAEKKGLPFMGPGGALEVSKSFNEAAQQTANLLKTGGEVQKTRLENYGKQLDYMSDDVAPILAETDPAKQESALNVFKAKVQFQPSKYPQPLVDKLEDINNAHDLAAFANSAKIHQEIMSLGTKQYEEQKAQAEALKATRAQAGIADEHGILTPAASAAVRSVQSYSALPPNLRTSFVSEMEHQPDWEGLQKVQARADAAQESFQRSADAREQAKAMKNVAVGQAMALHLITEDKALTESLAATKGIRSELDMTKGGNQMASAAAITRFAEHEVKAGGINRFNETELNAMGKSAGSWGRQMQTWIDKGMKGTPPDGTVGDMQAILDMEDMQAHATHDNNVNTIQNRFSGIAGGGIAPPAQQPGAHPFFSQFGGTARNP